MIMNLQYYAQWFIEIRMMIVQLSGVNFINVLSARFSYEISAQKNLYEKCERKTLMKLTPELQVIVNRH